MKRKFKVTVNGETFFVEVEEIQERQTEGPIEVAKPNRQVVAVERTSRNLINNGQRGLVTAPLPGGISKINVVEGSSVKRGGMLIVLEAMKMENEIYSPIDGVVREIYVEEGQQVGRGDRLLLVS